MSNTPAKGQPERDLTRAKADAEEARKRLASTMGTLQYRLKPGTLMHNAWDGMRDKGGEVADGAMNVAKERSMTVSGIVAAVLMFLAREPLLRFFGKLFGPAKDETVVTADLDHHDEKFDLTAPVVERSRHEGVSA